MKTCPMCGMPQLKSGVTVCEFCDYEEKPIEKLSKQEIHDLMAPYDYEWVEGGAMIVEVKNNRDIALRGSVTIPHFVTEIAEDALSHCKFLARIELPKNLRSIGDYAFAHCRDLFDVFIPASVSHIGRGAFADCYDLDVIRIAAPSQPDGWDREWLLDCSAKLEWSCIDEE